MTLPAQQQDSTTLHMERRFGSPVDQVWSAWTDPAEICQWFGPPGYETIEVSSDLRPGGEYTFKLRKAPDGNPFLLQGRFLEVDPGRRLVYTWRWVGENMDGYETVVTVDFEAAGDETRLRLQHEQFPSADDRNRHNHGWDGCFLRLTELRATPAPSGQMQRALVLAELRQGRQAVLDAVRGLTAEQLAWSPAPSQWSTAGVLEHLALAEDFSLQGVREASGSASGADLTPNDDAIFSMVRDRSQRFQAPPPTQPTGRYANPATAFLERRAELIQLVEADDGAVRRGEAEGPIPGTMWDRFQWLRASAIHSHRHCAQIEELRAAQGLSKTPLPATAALAEVVSFNRKPVEVYDALVNPTRHAAFTGAGASGEPREGGGFTAWDGYITGRYLELVPGRRIVCEWSTNEWPKEIPPSLIEFRFEPAGEGTRVTMRQTRIPSDQVDRYRQGWTDYYWTPLRKYLY